MPKAKEEQNQQEIQEELITELPTRKFGEKKEKPHLDGQERTIENVEIISAGREAVTKDGKDYKPTFMRVWYSETEFENYGGLYRFKNNDGTFGEVTFNPAAKNATAKLFQKWVAYVKKAAEEVSISDFVHGLKGRKIVLAEEESTYQGEKIFKNVVGKFL